MSPGYFMICLDVIVFIIFVVLFSFLYLTFMIYTLYYLFQLFRHLYTPNICDFFVCLNLLIFVSHQLILILNLI